MLPEEQALIHLEGKQAVLEEQVASAELALETAKTDIARFQDRYYQSVGRLYVQLDELNAEIASERATRFSYDAAAQSHARAAQAQFRKSAEEVGMAEASPIPPPPITPELKQAYRQAAKLMHPDRATTEAERLNRTMLMAQINRAYERGDRKSIEKLIAEYGQDPEAITGKDIASRIVKAIRRLAQLRRRLGEMQQEMEAQQQTEIFQFKQSVEKSEALGGNPLADLARQLMKELSERKIQLQVAPPRPQWAVFAKRYRASP